MPEPTAGRRAAKLRLGGMALRNGLLVHGPTHWAAAVRRRDGTIAAASGRKPRLQGRRQGRRRARRRAPRRGDARHPARQARAARGQAALPGRQGARRDARRRGRRARAARHAEGRRRRRDGRSPSVSLLPSLVALRGGELAEYHGVEHKAIAAYETDDADAADAAKEHDRCGSHLMAPLLASNLAGARAAAPHARPARAGRAVGGRRRVAGRSPSRSSSGASATPAAPSRALLRKPGPRAAAPARHARAARAAARGRARRARRDPARRAHARPSDDSRLKVELGARLPIAGR